MEVELAMSDDAKREIAEAFETMHEAVVESRGPAPIKPKGPGRSRPIIVTDAEGKPKRIATHDRLLESLLEREGVEAAVEGKRPRVVRCIECRAPVRVKHTGNLPKLCDTCREKSKRCVECGKPISGNGKLNLCPVHAMRHNIAVLSPEKRATRMTAAKRAWKKLMGDPSCAARQELSERTRQQMAATPDDVKRRNGRKWCEKMTSEERSEEAKRRASRLSSEARRERSRRAVASRDKDELAATCRKATAVAADVVRNMSPEKKRKRMEAAWAAKKAMSDEERAAMLRRAAEKRRRTIAEKQAANAAAQSHDRLDFDAPNVDVDRDELRAEVEKREAAKSAEENAK